MSGIVPQSYGSDPNGPRLGVDNPARPISPARVETAPPTILPPAVILPKLPAWLNPAPPAPDTPPADNPAAPPAPANAVARVA